VKSIDYSQVKITGGFWKEKLDMVKNSTVYAVYDRFVESHRFEALSCQWQEGQPNMPHIFWDSDVAKWIEGVAYLLRFERNEELEAIVDDAVEKIIANSDEHGYFNSHYLVTEQDKRFTDRNRHELYCAGHLMEAAVAYYESTGKDKFLKAMCKYADYIERIFKIEDSAAYTTPGHPELELALMRLYECTGEERYADLAKYFIDKHGNNSKDKVLMDWVNEYYNMDQMPLRQLREPTGHAVRALYLLSGMADIALKYDDKELLAACQRCYESVVSKRMYITGGVGSTHWGEAFTLDYHLPPRTAYAETCASIALVLFCQRMLKLENSAKYADTIERAMYNGILSGISLSGDAFFYENPLEIDLEFNHIDVSASEKTRYPITRRPKIFDCSCCPPNLVRFLASVGNYIFAEDEETLYINQYVDSVLRAEQGTVTLSTNYPVDGKVHISGVKGKKYLALRKPQWCENVLCEQPYRLENGYLYFEPGDKEELSVEFEMPVVAMASNVKVHENAGRIAITRGPVVYCAEAIDNISDLKCLHLDLDGEYKVGTCDFLLPSLYTTAYLPQSGDKLYCKANKNYEEIPLKLIPYYAFANREESSMQVWFLQK